MCGAEPAMKERGRSWAGTPEQQVQSLEAGRLSFTTVGPGERVDELVERLRLTSQRQSEQAWGSDLAQPVWPGLVGSVPGQTALELSCPGPVSGLLHVPICAIPTPRLCVLLSPAPET